MALDRRRVNSVSGLASQNCPWSCLTAAFEIESTTGATQASTRRSPPSRRSLRGSSWPANDVAACAAKRPSTMNLTALIFLVTTATALMLLPRRWAPVPLLATCCYMTLGQGVQLGPISLPIYRIVLAIGLLRVVLRQEVIAGSINAIDKLVVAWATWIVFASFFHESVPGAGPVYACGFVYNIVLVYFLTRVWCRDASELTSVLRIVAWLLVPVAIAMLAEHTLKKNFFGILFGGVAEGVYLRDGKIRAQGPFAHPLYAGTVGASCFPLLVGIARQYKFSATVGLSACVAIVLASTSSGPMMSLFMGILAILTWWRRDWLSAARWALVGAYAAAELLMSRPAYYLISKIDLTGSSTGWHRSRLIEAAFESFTEWWLFGTDRTVHWMGSAVDEAGRHSDITNYYIWVGVIGGFPAMVLLIAIMWRAFVWVGKGVRRAGPALQEHRFMIWCLGGGLLAHATTSLSMAYPDQSAAFFWLNISVASSMYSLVAATAEASSVVAPDTRQRAPRGQPGRRLSTAAARTETWPSLVSSVDASAADVNHSVTSFRRPFAVKRAFANSPAAGCDAVLLDEGATRETAEATPPTPREPDRRPPARFNRVTPGFRRPIAMSRFRVDIEN